MEITIYSNCRLTKSYNEVIQHNYLENYLTSLSKKSFNINYVYVSSKGRLPIELEPLGINYLEGNYMKIVDSNNQITRYFFIDTLEIVNGCAVIEYSEDIWSNYAHKMNIVKGNVSNLRYGIGNNLKNLPNEYLSNDKLTINSIGGVAEGLSKEFYIILTIQFYKSVTSDGITEREIANFAVGTQSGTTPFGYSYSASETLLKYIIQYMAVGNNLAIGTSSQYFKWFNYEIIDAYIIPKKYIQDVNCSFASGTLYRIYNESKTESYTPTDTDAVCYIRPIVNGIYTKSGTLQPNYKRYAVGTIDNFVVVQENGSVITFDYKFSFDDNNINLLLLIGTNIINITSSFKYEFPISVQTADVTQQQALARAVNNYQLKWNKEETIAKGVSNISFGTYDMLLGGAQLAGGDVRGASKVLSGAQEVTNSAIDMAYSLKKNDLKSWAVNYSAYKSSTSINTDNDLMVSCYYGIIEMVVSPDNEDYVNALIDTIGYNVLMITTDNSLIEEKQENQDYNIVRFSNVWLYGNVTHDIQSILEEILEKGIKIWFKSNV